MTIRLSKAESFEIRVCTCCMLTHANGECCESHHTEEPNPFDDEPWAKFPNTSTMSIAMGGEHNDTCTEADRAEGCDCGDLGFSWASCDGCGSPLGGDRYRFTIFTE